MSEVSGFIPDTISIVCAPEIEVNDLKNNKRKVTPVFVNDIHAFSGIERAKYWGGANCTEVSVENKALSNLELIGLESRGNNGRAYKVVDSDGYYFDLREDVLLEAISESGIKKGGKINGSYIWAVYGGHPRIVKVGSELHKAIERAGKRRLKSKIDDTDLKPGHIYHTKNGQKFVFIATVKTLFMSFKQSVSDLKSQRYEKRYLIYTPSKFSKNTIQEDLDKELAGSFASLQLSKTTNFVEEAGTVNITSNVVDKIRRTVLTEVAKSSHSKNFVVMKCGLAHMYENGSQLPKTPEYVKFLTLA